MKIEYSKIKTWFVTGASSGIGFELCTQLLDKGYNIVAVARRLPKFEHPNALCLSVDVTKAEEVSVAVQKAISHFGRIDVLVNNAGRSSYGTMEETQKEEMRNVMEVNYWGAYNTIKAILPHFRANHNGTIINNTSQSGIATRSYGSAYCSSKHALEGLTSSLWFETKNFCRVMALELGFFAGTEIAQNMPKELTQIEEYKNIPGFYKPFQRDFYNKLEEGVKILISTVEQEKLPRRLMLGKDALFQIKSEIEWIAKDLRNSKKISKSCIQSVKISRKISFCGIVLWRQKVKDNQIKISILGIPVYRGKITNI